MELTLTISALVIGVGLVGAMSMRERRPRQGLDVPFLPTTPVMFIGIVMVLLSAIHLLNMYGHLGR